MMKREELFAISTIAKDTMILAELPSILEEINAEMISRASLGHFSLCHAITYSRVNKHVHDGLCYNDLEKPLIKYYKDLGYRVYGSGADLTIAWDRAN